MRHAVPRRADRFGSALEHDLQARLLLARNAERRIPQARDLTSVDEHAGAAAACRLPQVPQHAVLVRKALRSRAWLGHRMASGRHAMVRRVAGRLAA